jgi:hypothetical protein
VSKFKVGDRVRVIRLLSKSNKHKIGDIFNIYSFDDIEGKVFRKSEELGDYFYESELELVESKKEENSDITKDLKKAIGFLDLHDKDQFMLDNIVATLEDRIDEIRSS